MEEGRERPLRMSQEITELQNGNVSSQLAGVGKEGAGGGVYFWAVANLLREYMYIFCEPHSLIIYPRKPVTSQFI
jgi:hypothetical protein